MLNKKVKFNDYANISQRDLEYYSIICFYGESGSGKSSYIDYLNKKYQEKSMKSFKGKKYNSKKSLIIIDEVLYLSDFIRVIPHCLFGKEVLIATHIPLVYYKIFSLFGKKILKINLEKFPQKIEFYLREHGYDFTEESIKIYAKKFLCTYTDLEIILESSDNEEKNFDRIFLNFLKYRNIGIYPNH